MYARATRLGYPQWGLGAPRGLELEPRSVGAPRGGSAQKAIDEGAQRNALTREQVAIIGAEG